MIGDAEIPRPKDYLSYATDFDPTRGHHGDCALFIRHDVAHTNISLQSSLQAVAVQIHLKKKYTILSLYLPPSTQVIKKDLSDLF